MSSQVDTSAPMRRAKINCPHCDMPAAVRSSRNVTRLVRDIYLQCTNVACGHTYQAQLAVVRTISPSAIPREGINLPIAPLRARPTPGEFRPANDDHAPGAQVEA